MQTYEPSSYFEETSWAEPCQAQAKLGSPAEAATKHILPIFRSNEGIFNLKNSKVLPQTSGGGIPQTMNAVYPSRGKYRGKRVLKRDVK